MAEYRELLERELWAATGAFLQDVGTARAVLQPLVNAHQVAVTVEQNEHRHWRLKVGEIAT